MKKKIVLWIILTVTVVFSSSAFCLTLPPEETLEVVADCLVESQKPIGAWGGVEEWNYTGPIVAGLVQAYEIVYHYYLSNISKMLYFHSIIYLNALHLFHDQYIPNFLDVYKPLLDHFLQFLQEDHVRNHKTRQLINN